MVRALCLVNTTLGDADFLRQGVAVCEETLALYGPEAGRPREEHPNWAALAPTQRHRLPGGPRRPPPRLAGGGRRPGPGGQTGVCRGRGRLPPAEENRRLPTPPAPPPRPAP